MWLSLHCNESIFQTCKLCVGTCISVNVVSVNGIRSARLIKADASERIVYTKDQIQPLLDFFTHSNMTDGLAKLVAAKRRAQEIIDVSINDPPPLVIVE